MAEYNVVDESVSGSIVRPQQRGVALNHVSANSTYSRLFDPAVITGGPFSFSCWFRRTSNTGTAEYILGSFVSTQRFYLNTASGGGIRTRFGTMAAAIGQGNNSDQPAATWHHCVVTVVPLGAVNLYVNGTLNDSGTHIGAFPDGNVLGLGDSISDDTPAGLNFNGQVSDLRFFDYILTGTDILDLYQYGPGESLGPVPTVAPWYKLDGRHPNIVYDSSGLGLHGTKVNTPTVYESGLIKRSFQNDVGYSDHLDLDGTQQLLATSKHPFGDHATTWTFRCKPSATGGATGVRYIAAQGSVITPYEISFDYDTDTYSFNYSIAGAGVAMLPLNVSYGKKEVYISIFWDNVAKTLTWTDLLTNQVIQVDGNVDIEPSSASNFEIGTKTLGSPFIGTLDYLAMVQDVAVYEYKLALSLVNQVDGSALDIANGPAPSPIPRDESNRTKDVLGCDLQYRGRVPRNVDMWKSNGVAGTNDDFETYAVTQPVYTVSYPFSLEANCTPNTDASLKTIISLCNDTNGSVYFAVQYDDGDRFAIVRRNTTSQQYTATVPKITAPVKLRVDFLSETSFDLYRDDVLVESVTGQPAVPVEDNLAGVPNSLIIANARFASGLAGGGHTIWDAKYYQGSSLVAHLPCSEGDGSTLHEIVLGNHATFGPNGMTWKTQDEQHHNETIGHDSYFATQMTSIGHAWTSFDRTLPTGNWKIKFRFKIIDFAQSGSDATNLIRQQPSTSGEGKILISIASDGESPPHRIRMWQDHADGGTLRSTDSMELDRWYDVVFYKNGTELGLILDGQQNNTFNTASDIDAKDGPFYIGNSSLGNTNQQGTVLYQYVTITDENDNVLHDFRPSQSMYMLHDVANNNDLSFVQTAGIARVPAKLNGTSVQTGGQPTNPAGVYLNNAETAHNFKVEPLAPWVREAEMETAYFREYGNVDSLIRYNGSLDPSSGVEVEGWFKFHDASQVQHLFRFGSDQYRVRRLVNGDISVRWGTGGTNFSTGVADQFPLNTWTHFRLVIPTDSLTGPIYAYINGALVLSETNDAASYETVSDFRLLHIATDVGSAGSARNIRVIVNNVLLVNDSLNSVDSENTGAFTKVIEEYSSGGPPQFLSSQIGLPEEHRNRDPLPPQMQSVITDAGFEREIQIISDRAFTNPDDFGTVGYFNGTDHSIDIVGAAAITGFPFRMECEFWVPQQPTGNRSTVSLCSESGTSGRYHLMTITSDDLLRMQSRQTAPSAQTRTARMNNEDTLRYGSWHTGVMEVYDKDNSMIFMDGIAGYINAAGEVLWDSELNTIAIGKHRYLSPSWYWEGIIRNVKVYDITDQANPVLLHHWPINEGEGTVINDIVGGANGTLTGDPLTFWQTAKLPGTDPSELNYAVDVNGVYIVDDEGSYVILG